MNKNTTLDFVKYWGSVALTMLRILPMLVLRNIMSSPGRISSLGWILILIGAGAIVLGGIGLIAQAALDMTHAMSNTISTSKPQKATLMDVYHLKVLAAVLPETVPGFGSALTLLISGLLLKQAAFWIYLEVQK